MSDADWEYTAEDFYCDCFHDADGHTLSCSAVISAVDANTRLRAERAKCIVVFAGCSGGWHPPEEAYWQAFTKEKCTHQARLDGIRELDSQQKEVAEAHNKTIDSKFNLSGR